MLRARTGSVVAVRGLLMGVRLGCVSSLQKWAENHL